MGSLRHALGQREGTPLGSAAEKAAAKPRKSRAEQRFEAARENLGQTDIEEAIGTLQ